MQSEKFCNIYNCLKRRRSAEVAAPVDEDSDDYLRMLSINVNENESEVTQEEVQTVNGATVGQPTEAEVVRSDSSQKDDIPTEATQNTAITSVVSQTNTIIGQMDSTSASPDLPKPTGRSLNLTF